MPSRILRLWNPTLAAWEEVGDSRLTAHLGAADPHSQYLLESLVDAKGDLLGASADNTPARLPVGTNGQVLTADSAQTLGLRWATPASGGMTDPTTTKGDLVARGASAPATRLAAGADGQVLTADSTQTLGLRWATGAAGGGMTDPTTTKGDLIVRAGVGSIAHLFDNTPWTTPSTTTPTDDWSVATRFTVGVSVQATGLRWYRATTTAAARPVNLRLYRGDGTLLATVTTVTDTLAVGWQTSALTTPITLATGTVYLATMGWPGGQTWAFLNRASIAAPPSPFAYDGNIRGFAQYNTNAFPATTDDTLAWGVDVEIGGGTGATTRIGVGTDGQVLTADGTQLLGVRWGAGPAGTYLPLAGGTLTGDLVLSEATPTVSLKLTADTQPRARLSDTALAFGPGGTTAPDITLQRVSAGALRVTGTGDALIGLDAAAAANASSLLWTTGGSNRWLLQKVPDASSSPLILYDYGTGGASFAERARWAHSGTLTLSADAAQPVLVATAGGGTTQVDSAGNVVKTAGSDLVLASATANVKVQGAGNVFCPTTDNAMQCGFTSLRWTAVYAVAGTINTSSADAKQDITPLDPAAAMTAVRNTTPCTFDYLAPERSAEWYELPDDPEQAEAVLYQRLVSGPLEAAARHQAGVVLDRPEYPCADLFRTGSGQTNPSNSVGILIAALKSLDTRLTALGG